MIFFLLSRDKFLRAGLVFAVLAPLSLLPVRNQSILRSGILAILWITAASIISMSAHWPSTRFEDSLPISGRHLFWTRVLSSVAIIWLPVATCLALILSRGPGGRVVSGFLEAGAILTLAALLPLAIRSWPWRGVSFYAVILVVPNFLFRVPPTILLAWLTGSILVAFSAAWIVAFRPIEPATLNLGARRVGNRPAWWPILRSVPVGICLLFAPIGLIAGLIPLLAVIPVLLLWLLNRVGTRWLEPMPLSHRARLAIILAPTLVLFLATTAAGTRFTPRPPFGIGPTLARSAEPAFPSTNVPLEFWQSGNPPMIRAPWGETVQPIPIRILGLTFYNPYAFEKSNSREFLDWQLQRATRAALGRPVSLAQIENDQVDITEVLNVTDGGRMQILAHAAYLYGALLAISFFEFAGGRPRRHLYFGAVVLLPLLATVALDGFYFYRYSTMVTAPLFRALLLHASAALPQNPWALAAIAILPALPLYWLLERQFARSEMAAPMQLAWSRQ